jgi:hypothetical protein
MRSDLVDLVVRESSKAHWSCRMMAVSAAINGEILRFRRHGPV